MRNSTILALALYYFSTCTDAVALQKRAERAPRVVGFPLERRTIQDPVSRDRLRRRGTVSATLDNLVRLAKER